MTPRICALLLAISAVFAAPGCDGEVGPEGGESDAAHADAGVGADGAAVATDAGASLDAGAAADADGSVGGDASPGIDAGEAPDAGPAFCPTPAGGRAFGVRDAFVPSEAEPFRILRMPTPDGETYSRLVLEMRVTHGGWYEPKPDGAHGIFQLTRGGEWGNGLYGYMTWRNSGLIRVLQNIGLPRGDRTRLEAHRRLDPGVTYDVEYVYDAAAGMRSLLIEGDGMVWADVSAADTGPVETWAPAFEIMLGVELACAGCGPEVPLHGWRFEDVCLRAIP